MQFSRILPCSRVPECVQHGWGAPAGAMNTGTSSWQSLAVCTLGSVSTTVYGQESNMPRLFPPHANLQPLISCLHSLSHSRVSWSYKGIGGKVSLYGLLVLFSLLMNLTSLYVSSSLFNLGILFLFCFRTTYAAKAIFAFVILLPKSPEFWDYRHLPPCHFLSFFFWK